MRMTMPARPVFWLGINPRPVPSRHRQWHLPARSPSQRWARHGIQPCSRFSRLRRAPGSSGDLTPKARPRQSPQRRQWTQARFSPAIKLQCMAIAAPGH